MTIGGEKYLQQLRTIDTKGPLSENVSRLTRTTYRRERHGDAVTTVQTKKAPEQRYRVDESSSMFTLQRQPLSQQPVSKMAICEVAKESVAVTCQSSDADCSKQFCIWIMYQQEHVLNIISLDLSFVRCSGQT